MIQWSPNVGFLKFQDLGSIELFKPVQHFPPTLLIDIDTKMILYMGRLTRRHLRLSSLGNATYSWLSGKFTDFQISILCHHIVFTKCSFGIYNQKSSKYVHSLLRNNSTKMQAKKTTYIGVPKLFANISNAHVHLVHHEHTRPRHISQ